MTASAVHQVLLDNTTSCGWEHVHGPAYAQVGVRRSSHQMQLLQAPEEDKVVAVHKLYLVAASAPTCANGGIVLPTRRHPLLHCCTKNCVMHRLEHVFLIFQSFSIDQHTLTNTHTHTHTHTHMPYGSIMCTDTPYLSFAHIHVHMHKQGRTMYE